MINMSCKLFISLLISAYLFFPPTLANSYVGFGGILSRNQYKVSSGIISGQTSLTTTYNVANSTISIFDGTREELIQMINSAESTDLQFNLEVSGVTTYKIACVINNNRILSFATTAPACPATTTGIDINANNAQSVTLVADSLGRTFFNAIEKLGKESNMLKIVSSDSSLYAVLGQKIMNTIIAKNSNGGVTTQEKLLNAFDNSSFFNDPNTGVITTNAFAGDPMGRLEAYRSSGIPEAAIDALVSSNIFGITFLVNGNRLSMAEVIELDSIKDTASSTNLQASLLTGWGQMMNKTYFGLELGIDLGPVIMGKSSKQEIELSSNYTIFGIGRIGYHFFEDMLHYLNGGFAVRKYDTKYDGTYLDFKDSGFVNHFMFGVGVEYKHGKDYNLFVELNHVLATSGVKTGAPNGRLLNALSTQLKVGVRYYLDDNIIPSSPHRERSEQCTRNCNANIKLKRW